MQILILIIAVLSIKASSLSTTFYIENRSLYTLDLKRISFTRPFQVFSTGELFSVPRTLQAYENNLLKPFQVDSVGVQTNTLPETGGTLVYDIMLGELSVGSLSISLIAHVLQYSFVVQLISPALSNNIDLLGAQKLWAFSDTELCANNFKEGDVLKTGTGTNLCGKVIIEPKVNLLNFIENLDSLENTTQQSFWFDNIRLCYFYGLEKNSFIYGDFDDKYNSVSYTLGKTNEWIDYPLIDENSAVEFYQNYSYKKVACNQEPDLVLFCQMNEFGTCIPYFDLQGGYYLYTHGAVKSQSQNLGFPIWSSKFGAGPLIAYSSIDILDKGNSCFAGDLPAYGKIGLCFMKV